MQPIQPESIAEIAHQKELLGQTYNTFSLIKYMELNWRFDRRGKVPGPISSNLCTYKTKSGSRIEGWSSQIHRLTDNNLVEILKEEEKAENRRKNNPNLTYQLKKYNAQGYSRRLLSRICALKLRIKKKEEELELHVLRKLANRLNLMHQNNLLPKLHSEILLEDDEQVFYRRLNKMRIKAGKPRLYSEAFAKQMAQ